VTSNKASAFGSAYSTEERAGFKGEKNEFVFIIQHIHAFIKKIKHPKKRNDKTKFPKLTFYNRYFRYPLCTEEIWVVYF